MATASAPGAPGAQARLSAGRERLALRRTGGSYLAASDERILFGLGDVPAKPRAHEVEITWTTGRCELFGPLAENAYHAVTEGSGRPCGEAGGRARGPSPERSDGD